MRTHGDAPGTPVAPKDPFAPGVLTRLLDRLTITRALRRARGARDPLGPAAERVAARRLRARGMRILERNARTPIGEVDIVALAPDRRTIVIVEVKARRLGPRERPRPEAAVGARKQRKLLFLADDIARRRGWQDRPVRIDVVAVDVPARGGPVVRHYERAVTW